MQEKRTISALCSANESPWQKGRSENARRASPEAGRDINPGIKTQTKQ
jgi:hypothetical protein